MHRKGKCDAEEYFFMKGRKTIFLKGVGVLYRKNECEETRYYLKDIIEVLPDIDSEVLQKRFSKIMKSLIRELNCFKDEQGRYFFYSEEKDLLILLLQEYRDPVIFRLINNRSLGSTLEDRLQLIEKFRKKFQKMANGMTCKKSKSHLEAFIKEICDNELSNIGIEMIKKIRIIGEFINHMSTDERIRIIKDINKSLTIWMGDNIPPELRES